MKLCARCELVHGQCKPLVGMICKRQLLSYPLEPVTGAEVTPQTRAAVIQDHRTGRVHISTILILDFYAGWL